MEKPRGWGGLSGRDDQSGRKGWPKTWPRAVMRRGLVVAMERETYACGRMGYLLPEIFPPVGRSN